MLAKKISPKQEGWLVGDLIAKPKRYDNSGLEEVVVFLTNQCVNSMCRRNFFKVSCTSKTYSSRHQDCLRGDAAFEETNIYRWQYILEIKHIFFYIPRLYAYICIYIYTDGYLYLTDGYFYLLISLQNYTHVTPIQISPFPPRSRWKKSWNADEPKSQPMLPPCWDEDMIAKGLPIRW